MRHNNSTAPTTSAKSNHFAIELAGKYPSNQASYGKIRPYAPVAQWIEQSPPKGQVARSIRVWGAKQFHQERHLLIQAVEVKFIKEPLSVCHTENRPRR